MCELNTWCRGASSEAKKPAGLKDLCRKSTSFMPFNPVLFCFSVSFCFGLSNSTVIFGVPLEGLYSSQSQTIAGVRVTWALVTGCASLLSLQRPPCGSSKENLGRDSLREHLPGLCILSAYNEGDLTLSLGSHHPGAPGIRMTRSLHAELLDFLGLGLCSDRQVFVCLICF